MEIMCTCGSWLELRDGKYGTFFLCENCGPISKSKALQMKEITAEQVKEETKTEETVKEEPKEINITTDDAEYF